MDLIGKELITRTGQLYPSFWDEKISYPIARSSWMCFQTADRVIPSSLLIVSPETGVSVRSRISRTLNAESGKSFTALNRSVQKEADRDLYRTPA